MTAGSRRPSHLIQRHEVAIWLADSVVKVVTYHNTTPQTAPLIRRYGVNIEASRIGTFGQGFYTTTVPDPFFGDVTVPVAIRLRDPLIGHLDDIAVTMEQLVRRMNPIDGRLTPPVGRLIRREFLDAGYDGLVVHDAGGDGVDYVISIVNEAVRVVVDA